MALVTATTKQVIGISALLLLSFNCNFALASTDLQVNQLQKQLIDLRTTVDEKSAELSLLRQENKQKRQFMLSQIAEIKASIEHKSLVIAKIDSKLKKNKAFLETVKSDDVLEKDIDTAINELRHYISENLPFKINERLAALDEMQQQLESRAVSAPRLANKLWAFVEDEITLTKGNGVYRQIINLEHEQKLVDVARVGMMMLYYRDGAGNVGMARKKGGQTEIESWQFVALNSKEETHQIHFLFDSFQKQVRFGEFTLPNALANSQSTSGVLHD